MDPATITLASLGSEALKEGIKFLYGQASEVLKQWRSRQKKDGHEGAHSHIATDPLIFELPTILKGDLHAPSINFDEIARSESELVRVAKLLSSYVNGIQPVEQSDPELLGYVAELRAILEAIYQQHITFRGENRPPSGTILTGTVRVTVVQGEATGVDGEGTMIGQAKGFVEAERVEAGGTVTGVKWKV